MNLPQVYMCSPSWTLLPPPSAYHPSGSSQCTSPSIQYRASNWTGDLFHIWYYTYFNAILPNHPTLSLSHRVQKTVLYISVSFAVSYTGLLFKLLTPRLEDRLTWIKGRSVSSITAPQHILPKKYLSLGFFSEDSEKSPWAQRQKKKEINKDLTQSPLLLLTYSEIFFPSSLPQSCPPPHP